MPSPWSESANSVAETAPRMIWSVVVSVFPEMAKLDISTLTKSTIWMLKAWVSGFRSRMTAKAISLEISLRGRPELR